MENLRCVFEIIVALGALGGFIACFPIIRNWFRKADLELIKIGEDITVSSKYGTRLTLKMAFLAKNKKAIITKIETRIKHDKGEECTLTCKYMEEYFGDSEILNVMVQRNSKFQNFLVLITHIDYPVEKSLIFIENPFLLQENEFKQKVREKIILLEKQGKSVLDLKKEAEYISLIDNFEKNFFWKEGKYNVEVTVFLKNKKVLIKKLEFRLTSVEIILLQSDCKNSYSKRLEKIFIDNAIDITELPANTVGITAKIIE
jgi:hypothetical protein